MPNKEEYEDEDLYFIKIDRKLHVDTGALTESDKEVIQKSNLRWASGHRFMDTVLPWRVDSISIDQCGSIRYGDWGLRADTEEFVSIVRSSKAIREAVPRLLL
jgi:hypothetical protein